MAASRLTYNDLDLGPAYPQCVRDPIDVIEPGSDQRYLQYALVIKARCSQLIVMLPADFCRVSGQLYDVVEHNLFLRSYRG